jgi:hypothetical protein
LASVKVPVDARVNVILGSRALVLAKFKFRLGPVDGKRALIVMVNNLRS